MLGKTEGKRRRGQQRMRRFQTDTYRNDAVSLRHSTDQDLLTVFKNYY